MKTLLNKYRDMYRANPRKVITYAAIGIGVATLATLAAIFVSPWAGALLVVAAVVLMDDCGEVAE